MTSLEWCHGAAIQEGELYSLEELRVKTWHCQLSKVIRSGSRPNITQIDQELAKQKAPGWSYSTEGCTFRSAGETDSGDTKMPSLWYHVRCGWVILMYLHVTQFQAWTEMMPCQQSYADKQVACCWQSFKCRQNWLQFLCSDKLFSWRRLIVCSQIHDYCAPGYRNGWAGKHKWGINWVCHPREHSRCWQSSMFNPSEQVRLSKTVQNASRGMCGNTD